MKIIILTFLLFFSFINITNAFPVAVLLLWYDFVLLSIPFILWCFTTIYFYFRKYIFSINIFLFFINISLYIYYFLFLKEEIFFKYEWILFLLPILIFWLIFKYKLNFLSYILLVFLLWIFAIIWKLDYDIFDFYRIEKCILKNIPNWLETKFIYKKSYLLMFWKYSNYKSHIVIDKNANSDSSIPYYLSWGIGISYDWNGNILWQKLVKIWIKCLK